MLIFDEDIDAPLLKKMQETKCGELQAKMNINETLKTSESPEPDTREEQEDDLSSLKSDKEGYKSEDFEKHSQSQS